MKLLFRLFLVFVIGGLNSCFLFENDSDPVLPRITMEGKNTFGCLINGKVWIPSRDLHADMSVDNYLQISADANNSCVRLTLHDVDGIQPNKTYAFENNDTCYPEHCIVDKLCLYSYDQLLSGHMIITKLETNIISGTFEFQMGPYDSECGSVTVTKGRFDIGVIYR